MINVESTARGVPGFGIRVRGLRIALGAAGLALGWLVVGAVSGGDSASAAEIPPLTPDALGTSVVGTSLLADATAMVISTIGAAPSPVQDVAAPVVRVTTRALDVVADTVDLIPVEQILPILTDGPAVPPDVAPVVTTPVADGARVTAVEPPSSAFSAPIFPVNASPATQSQTSDPPSPARPATPTNPAEALVPTAPASVATEGDLTRSPWAPQASGGAVLPAGEDCLPCPPAFDFDPTPD